MRRFLSICLLIVLLSCAAVWGAKHIGLFPRLSQAFSSLLFGTSNVSNHGRPTQTETQDAQSPAQNVRGGGRANGHTMASPWESCKNVFAYFAVFAFVVMATYYSEQGLCVLTNRRKRSLLSS